MTLDTSILDKSLARQALITAANNELYERLDLPNLKKHLSKVARLHWDFLFKVDLLTLIESTPNSDLPRWINALEQLPILSSDLTIEQDLTTGVGLNAAINQQQSEQIHNALTQLIPWRKGPFQIFDTFIDTEWRSNLKWERLASHLNLQNCHILDVGCGNGYYGFRMLGAGARSVLGIDPNYLFLTQFLAIKHYMSAPAIWQLPMTLDHFNDDLKCFDVTFSMGVLYHRKSPLEHLEQLRSTLKKGGTLVLETMTIEGDERTVLIPQDRYAKMGNVWFLPSIDMLILWLQRLGFNDVKCVDISVTTTDEQRATAWMRYQSLTDFLDPKDSAKTIEGYPAPKRAIILAKKS